MSSSLVSSYMDLCIVLDCVLYYFVYSLVGKLFIDIADIYCFGTGLPISRSKHVFQYRHFK